MNLYLYLIIFGLGGLVAYLIIFAAMIVKNHQNFRANSDLAEEMGVADDLQDIGNGRITTTLVLGVIT